MTRPLALLIAALAIVLGACDSDSTRTCGYDGATQLANTTWPSARADPANSGRAPVDLTTSSGQPSVVFQARCSALPARACLANSDCPAGQTCMPITAVSAAPVIGPPGFIYLPSRDGTVYVLDLSGQPVPGLRGTMVVSSPLTQSPLAGANGNIFVPSVGGVAQFFNDGTIRNATTLPGTVTAPNMWSVNGSIYVGTQGSVLSGICPNGVPRFAVSFTSPIENPPIVVQDPNVEPGNLTPIIVGADENGTVRAFTRMGKQYWSFSAGNPIEAAIVVDELREPVPVFYTADTSGRIFAVNLANGQLVSTPPFAFSTAGGAPIIGSPALGRDIGTTPGTTLYVGDQNGVLYALDRVSGAIRWTYTVAGSINSSLAVATGGPQDVIVFAADLTETESRVYAVRDDGTAATSLWQGQDGEDGVPVCGGVGMAAPAIGEDGTVYLGLEVLAPTSDPECAGVVQTNGGALVAIAP